MAKKLNIDRAIHTWYMVTLYQIDHDGMAYTKACAELAEEWGVSREHTIDLYIYGRNCGQRPETMPYREDGKEYMVAPQFLENEILARRVETRSLRQIKRASKQKVRRWAKKRWPDNWEEIINS